MGAGRVNAAAVRRLARAAARTAIGQQARRSLDAAIASARTLKAFGGRARLINSAAAREATQAFRRARAVTEADVALCERLIRAYQLAAADNPSPGGMWAHRLFAERQRPLVVALEEGHAERLAELLASMFRSGFVLGLAPGSLGVGQTGRLRRRLSALHILSKLAALAESQGLARVENPEQGRAGRAFARDAAGLVAELEAILGVSVDFPAVGAAYGIEVAGRLLTPDSPDQVYAAVRLRDAAAAFLPRRDPLRVVEIGGGYGAMAFWLLQMLDADYTIIDLPAVSVLQGYFLGSTIGAAEVSLYGEPPRRVAVLPKSMLASIAPPADVVVNKDSLPEIPEPEARRYLAWIRTGCKGVFYSYNQEGAAPFADVPQLVVPELLDELGGFERLRRDQSWLRRGYVEEIYRVHAVAS